MVEPGLDYKKVGGRVRARLWSDPGKLWCSGQLRFHCGQRVGVGLGSGLGRRVGVRSGVMDEARLGVMLGLGVEGKVRG